VKRRSAFVPVMLLTLVLTLALVLPAWADTAAAVEWLKEQQRPDGGFGMEKSTLSETTEVIYALAAAGEDVASVQKEGKSPLDFLAANIGEATSVGAKAKVALAAAYSGGNAYDVAGTNLVGEIVDSQQEDGMYGGADDSLLSHTYAVLALASVGEEIPARAIEYLKTHQADNGAWAWNGSTIAADADTNSTALVLQALVAAGVPADDAAIQQALEYLRSVQNDDGGFPYQKPSDFGTDTDANSTSVVIQALIAVGEDPSQWVSDEGSSPLDALNALQNESGAFAWQAAFPDDNLLSTAQAVPALAGKAHPIRVAAAVAPATVEETLPSSGGAVPAAQVFLLMGGSLVAVGYAIRRRVGSRI